MNRHFSIQRIIGFLGLVLLFVLIFTGTVTYTQAKADDTVRLNVTETAIAKDGVFRLRVYNVPKNAKVVYRSSDISVAYVDNRGYITGISNGECVVTATVVVNGEPADTLRCNVTIGPAAISIKLTKSEIVLGIGMKKTLKTIISPLNTVEKPVFYSSDKDIASVTTIGRVRAKNAGETEIFAFLLNGESAECKVYVLDEDDYKTFTETGTLVGIIEGYSESDDDGRDDTDNNQNPDETDTPETDDITPAEEPTKEPAPTSVKEIESTEKETK